METKEDTKKQQDDKKTMPPPAPKGPEPSAPPKKITAQDHAVAFSEAKDKKRALSQFETLADADDVAAAEFCAGVYFNGIKLDDFELKQDLVKYKKYIRIGIESGSTQAMLHAASHMMETGDHGKARELLDLAKSLEDWNAENSLGVLAVKEDNMEKACDHFELAMSKGVPQARQNLVISLTHICNAASTKAHRASKRILTIMGGGN